MQRMYKLAATLLIAAAMIGTPAVAFAEEPTELTSNFQDLAGVVKDDAATRSAIEEVPGKDLWVVVVKNFGGTDAYTWAQRTAQKSGLQQYDGLVAISAEGSDLGYQAGGTGITASLLKEALSDKRVLDAFHNGEWDAGIQRLAANVKTLLEGGSIASKTPLYILLAAALVVVVLLVIILRRNAKKKAQADAESLRELAARASSELVQVDDAVRSASAELEFARAEFGLQATQDFAASLEQAKQNMQQAFSLRTLLDDDHPETPAQQRQMNTQILQLADSTRAALQAQEKGFSELRNLAARVEEKIAQLETRNSEITHQLPLAQAKLDNLALSYPEAMLRTLNSYPDQVAKLLDGVQTSLAQAREHIAHDDRNSAVSYAKLAEGTLESAAQMVSRIDAAPQLIEQAQSQLAANIQSLSSDVADVQRLGAGDTTILDAQRTAQAALDAAQNAAAQDLFALNERLEDAEAHLDRALAGVREQEQVALKQAQAISAAKATAQARIDEAEQFITSYRSGVGPDARTYLARAHTQFAQALSAPAVQQEQLFRSAASLAKRALSAAEQSIESDHHGQSGDSTMGSFLAGMVISSVLSGMSRGPGSTFGGGGNFGGGGFGGGNFGGGGAGGGRIGF